MNKKPLLIEKKLFESFSEPALSFSSVKKKDYKLLGALVEAFNKKYDTRFYMDKKRQEIVHAGIIREAEYAPFAKLRGLLEHKSFAVKLCESQVSYSTAFSRLMESELEQAEVVLAAQSITDRLQKMAEDLAQMVSEDVLPVSDQMKTIFGTDFAESWASTAKESLERAFETVSGTKDAISDATRVLENHLEGEPAPATDMAKTDVGGDDLDLDGDDLGLGDEGGDDDLLGGADAAAGEEDNPLGREKKESVQNKKKALNESERLFVANLDFDVVAEYKDFVLGSFDHDDGDVRKVDYEIYKFEKEEKAEGLPRPQRKYSRVKSLGLSPYVDENEAVKTFKQAVDSGKISEAFGRKKPSADIGAGGNTTIKIQDVYDYDHLSGVGIQVTRNGGNRPEDRFRLPPADASELVSKLRITPEEQHQDLLRKYFSDSIYKRENVEEDLGMDFTKFDNAVASTKKAERDEPFVYDTEGHAVVIRKGHSTMSDNAKTLSAADSLDFLRAMRDAGDEFEKQRIMAEYYNMGKGVYEHDDPSPYVGKLKSSGYDVNIADENGIKFFAISKIDFNPDEMSTQDSVLHVVEPREGVYMIDMNYKKTFDTLADAVAYHFKDDSIKETCAGGVAGVAMPLGGKKKRVKEGGMPASVIKSKTRYAEMSDEELAKRFADKSEEELRQMAWRHGYGKMSDHYVKRVANGSKTESSPFAYAAKKAKEQGEDEFELDGKTFKVESVLESEPHLEVDQDVKVIGNVRGEGQIGRVAETAPSGAFYVVEFEDGSRRSYHGSDLEPAEIEEDTDLAKKAVAALSGNQPNKPQPTSNAPEKPMDPREQKKIDDFSSELDRNPRLKKSIEDLVSEAIATIKEDLVFGISEPKAIKNAAMMYGIDNSELTEAWMAKK